MTKAELIAKFRTELGSSLASSFSPDDYSNAYDLACSDTGFECPTTVEFEIFWLKNRMKRHFFDWKRDRTIENFDVPKAKLEQIYKHYDERIKEMDAEFEEAQATYPVEFGLSDDSNVGFGEVVTSGFVKDPLTGADKTYDEAYKSEKRVLINGN